MICATAFVIGICTSPNAYDSPFIAAITQHKTQKVSTHEILIPS